MERFDKCMALDVIEDALTDIFTQHGRGMVTGLCGAFYMCGLLNAKEWEAFLERIPAGLQADGDDEICGINESKVRNNSRVLN